MSQALPSVLYMIFTREWENETVLVNCTALPRWAQKDSFTVVHRVTNTQQDILRHVLQHISSSIQEGNKEGMYCCT